MTSAMPLKGLLGDKVDSPEAVNRLIYAYALVLDVAPLTKTYSDSSAAVSTS